MSGFANTFSHRAFFHTIHSWKPCFLSVVILKWSNTKDYRFQHVFAWEHLSTRSSRKSEVQSLVISDCAVLLPFLFFSLSRLINSMFFTIKRTAPDWSCLFQRNRLKIYLNAKLNWSTQLSYLTISFFLLNKHPFSTIQISYFRHTTYISLKLPYHIGCFFRSYKSFLFLPYKGSLLPDKSSSVCHVNLSYFYHRDLSYFSPYKSLLFFPIQISLIFAIQISLIFVIQISLIFAIQISLIFVIRMSLIFAIQISYFDQSCRLALSWLQNVEFSRIATGGKNTVSVQTFKVVAAQKETESLPFQKL